MKRFLIILYLLLSLNVHVFSQTNQDKFKEEIESYVTKLSTITDNNQKSFYYNKIGYIYWINLKDYDKALEFFELSIDKNKEVKMILIKH